MTPNEETRYKTAHTLGIHLETGPTAEANLCGQYKPCKLCSMDATQTPINSNSIRMPGLSLQQLLYDFQSIHSFTRAAVFKQKESLLQANLKVFMTFATDTFGNDSKIMKNLKEFQPVLPTATPTEDPIFIENKNLGDFRMKLEEYLVIIRNYLKSKNIWFS
ncbi:hypothetical protein E5288_WYG002616 [Bos mutus]|uniref:Interleukin-3 n=1 Tax=Bos mutus TaxID=72004 RepID=A0A6B0R8J7_9CETA|nr:hypothetical protein [Bos mutus]